MLSAKIISSCLTGFSAPHLAQKLAEGKSLAQMIQEGWRGNEQEATRIAQEMLRNLGYLSRCRPAVTHR